MSINRSTNWNEVLGTANNLICWYQINRILWLKAKAETRQKMPMMIFSNIDIELKREEETQTVLRT